MRLRPFRRRNVATKGRTRNERASIMCAARKPLQRRFNTARVSPARPLRACDSSLSSSLSPSSSETPRRCVALRRWARKTFRTKTPSAPAAPSSRTVAPSLFTQYRRSRIRPRARARECVSVRATCVRVIKGGCSATLHTRTRTHTRAHAHARTRAHPPEHAARPDSHALSHTRTRKSRAALRRSPTSPAPVTHDTHASVRAETRSRTSQQPRIHCPHATEQPPPTPRASEHSHRRTVASSPPISTASAAAFAAFAAIAALARER